jgi:hypothetical protein
MLTAYRHLCDITLSGIRRKNKLFYKLTLLYTVFPEGSWLLLISSDQTAYKSRSAVNVH